MNTESITSNLTPPDYKEGYNKDLGEFYPDGTISCSEDSFGEYYIPDLLTLRLAKKEATKMFKNHKWPANKVARKVAEKLRLKKYSGPRYIDPSDKYNEPTVINL